MNDLATAVRQLAYLHVKSPALLAQTPDGRFTVLPDCVSAAGNQVMISRSQLGSLMWEHGFRREELADKHTAATLAAIVASFAVRTRVIPAQRSPHPASAAEEAGSNGKNPT